MTNNTINASGAVREPKFTYLKQGRSEDFGEGGALSGAERQIVPLVARVRRREAPPIEQWHGSGGAA